MSARNKDYTYEELELMIARLLTREPNRPFNHHLLVNKISFELGLKDPGLLKKLKDDIGIVMRFMKKYDNFDVIEENGSIRVVYITKISDSNVFEIVEPPSEKEDTESTSIQSGLAVAQFITDNDLTDFLKQKDHNGNTALHYFMIHGDILRAEKLIKFNENILLYENNEGFTPIELITDIRLSNYLLKNIIDNNISMRDDVDDIQIKLNKTIEDLNEFKLLRDLVCYIILSYLIFYFFYFYFF